MASKRHIRRKSCGDKVKYSTVYTARRALKRIIKQESSTHKLHVYKCPFCKQYHLGGIKGKGEIVNV